MVVDGGRAGHRRPPLLRERLLASGLVLAAVALCVTVLTIYGTPRPTWETEVGPSVDLETHMITGTGVDGSVGWARAAAGGQQRLEGLDAELTAGEWRQHLEGLDEDDDGLGPDSDSVSSASSNEESRTSRRNAHLIRKADAETQDAVQEGIEGQNLQTRAARECKIADHLQYTDDGLSNRARTQREAATSLEGRAAMLAGEADKEVEAAKALKKKGVAMLKTGRVQLTAGNSLLESIKHVNATKHPQRKARLHLEGDSKEDAGGSAVSKAHIILRRAKAHAENADALRAESARSAAAAKATLEIGQKLERRAVSHRLKTMTYRSKCTMMRAKSEAALSKAQDEAQSAKALRGMAKKPDGGVGEHRGRGQPVALLQIGTPLGAAVELEQRQPETPLWSRKRQAAGHSARALQQLEQRFGGARTRTSGESDDFVEQQRAKHQSDARRRIEAKRQDEEEHMAALRVALRNDRDNYHEARVQARNAETETRTAVQEDAHAAALRRRARDDAAVLRRRERAEARLRARLQMALKDQREQGNARAMFATQTAHVEKTMSQVAQQAAGERQQAMQLRDAALHSLKTSRLLEQQARSLNALAGTMDATSKADMNQARDAAQTGRSEAAAALSSADKAPFRGAGGEHLTAAVSADVASAQERATAAAQGALRRVGQASRAAAALEKEATAYRHKASELLIEADEAAARAPQDLQVASRELHQAAGLRAHVEQMQEALRDAQAAQRRKEQHEAGPAAALAAKKREQVASLAAMMKADMSLSSETAQLRERATELSDKARADHRAAQLQAREARQTVHYARASEDSDEGKLHVLQRRWRSTEGELAELDRDVRGTY
jgi:hypothetical protein